MLALRQRVVRLSSVTSCNFLRGHSGSSGCSHGDKADEILPVGALKKLVKMFPSTAPSQPKRHSCEPMDPSVPVSEAIRRRIIAAGARYHSNDNICEFVREDEMPLLVEEVARHMQGVLR